MSDQKGKKLFTCFIDFQKAFDSVWHDGLFRKLENKGINGNFLNLIKNIYNSTKCAVKINNKTTNFFKYERGVQQGNPLSPLLFNLFINDIFEATKNDHSMLTLDEVRKFNTLMYADDLILMSTTKEGLQKSLNALYDYCHKWKLNINMKKTKTMIFSQGTNIKHTKFYLNGTEISDTRTFKYLGITINSKNCSFTATLEDLSSKAKRATYALLNKLPLKLTPIKTLVKLFDTCIVPILLYGSEIWAPFTNLEWKKWEYTHIEKVHTQFLKRILGVNRSTTNALVRAELGRHSLLEQITNRNINYIKYIQNKSPQALVKQAAAYEDTCNSRTNLHSIFKKYEHANLNHNLNTLSKYKIRSIIKNDFNLKWQTYINSYTKADTFKSFKNIVKFEPYLEDIENRKYRVAFSKLRLSDHCLMIEKGRQSRPILSREQRKCPFCTTEIENEVHFITKCSAYNRFHLYEAISLQTPNFRFLNNEQQFIFLMSQEDQNITYTLAHCTFYWLKTRRERDNINNLSL